ncbi:MAG: hypothetical protein WDM76_04730 [Limisphaerales bacterium]
MLEQTGAFAQAELTDIDPDSVALTNILQVRQVVARHEGVNRFVRFAGSICGSIRRGINLFFRMIPVVLR